MKRTAALLLALLMLLAGPAARGEEAALTALLSDLYAAYQGGRAAALPEDGIARAVAEAWMQVFLDPDYPIYLCGKDDPAVLPVTGAHAFVVLGYELKNGEMTDELRGRCDAAAEAARTFPGSRIICTGGASGLQNPEQRTEAGLMADYLMNRCGIDQSRIILEKRALNTVENAVHTFALLRAHGIESVTLVTSSCHLRRSQVLFLAEAALYRQQYGSSVQFAGNFCLDSPLGVPLVLNEAASAVYQLSLLLNLPTEEQNRLLLYLLTGSLPAA